MSTKSIESPDLKALMLSCKSKVDVELEKYLTRKVKQFSEISPFAENFMKDLAEFTLRGGKRFRPILMYYAYKLLGGTDDYAIRKISIFLELIQSFLLIHDDIMDRALLRRGETTIHKMYEQYSKDQAFNDDVHFGTTMGILSGDLANQLAFEIIGESNFPLENKDKLFTLVSQEISKVCFGQIHDILLNYNYPDNYSEEDIIKVHFYKTATYTYELPLFAGAILAGADKKELKILEEYAVPSGIAFQIRDDILGVFGEVGETGKDIKGDLIEGKKTLLVTEAYKNANEEQKNILARCIGKKDLSDIEADQVRQVFENTGALIYSIAECQRQVNMAKEALTKLSRKQDEAYSFLMGIADYMVVRKT